MTDDSYDARRWRTMAPRWAEALNRRAEVEQLMFDAARGKRPMPTAEELRAWALRLGVPGEMRAEVQPPAAPPSPVMDSLVCAGLEMRTLQREYFRTRTKDALIASKEAERQFDRMLAAAPRDENVCPHGIHYDNACGACVPPRGTTVRR